MAIKETPPDDDVCPICFGDYVHPYRAQCGHWYCGSCILQVWSYGNAMGPCKCPMCSRLIKVFTPGVSYNQQDPTNKDDIRKVAKAIERYNRLFVGGPRGCLVMIRETPFFIGQSLRVMADPNQVDNHYMKWRLLSLTLVSLYMMSPFNFNFNFTSKPMNIQIVTNMMALVAVTLIKVVGWYRRRRSAERVRRLAAAEFVHGQWERNE